MSFPLYQTLHAFKLCDQRYKLGGLGILILSFWWGGEVIMVLSHCLFSLLGSLQFFVGDPCLISLMQIMGKCHHPWPPSPSNLCCNKIISQPPSVSYRILSSSHIFTISTLKLKPPLENSLFSELRTHAIGSKTSTT